MSHTSFFLRVIYIILEDNVESNISMVEVDTHGASQELRTAAVYQRRAGRRAACLMIVLTIVTAVVLLAVGFGSYHSWGLSHMVCFFTGPLIVELQELPSSNFIIYPSLGLTLLMHMTNLYKYLIFMYSEHIDLHGEATYVCATSRTRCDRDLNVVVNTQALQAQGY